MKGRGDPLTLRALRGALGGVKQALNRETGYRALEVGECQTDGPDTIHDATLDARFGMEGHRRAGAYIMSPAEGSYPRTFAEFIKRFDTEEACLAYVELIRWPNGFVCPFCGVVAEPWKMGDGKLRCKTCRKRTSVVGCLLGERLGVARERGFRLVLSRAARQPSLGCHLSARQEVPPWPGNDDAWFETEPATTVAVGDQYLP